MPLFSKPSDEPRRQPRTTINGHPARDPEGPGRLQRRFRLFAECARLLSGSPLVSPRAHGVPVGDGAGLEGLVSAIAPLFTRERSMIRWVTLRGAIAHLYVETWDEDSRSVPFYPVVETTMGVGHLSGPDDQEEVVGVALDWSSQLSDSQKSAACGIYSSVWSRLLDYGRYSKLDVGMVNADPRLQFSDAIGLDIIAWVAVAALRLDHDFSDFPEPDALDAPGWYCDPLFGKAERYWDGADWTARCRVSTGRRYDESTLPLRPQ